MQSIALLKTESETKKARLKELAAALETRSLTDDEGKEVDGIKDSLKDINAKLERAEYLQRIARDKPPANKDERDFQTRSRQFSLSKLIAKAAGKAVDVGSEIEISTEMKRNNSLATGDYVMPFEALETRTIMTDASTAGANKLKTENYDAPMFINYLRNMLVTAQAGATILRGSSNAIRIPRQTNTTKARWLAEGGAATNDDLTFDSVELKPRKLMGLTSWSAQTALESDPSIEMICRNDLMQVIAHEIDRAALYGGEDKNGKGAANANKDVEPQGLSKRITALDATTAGADLTYAKALNMAKTADEGNIMMGRRAFICNPAIKYKAMQTLLTSSLTSADYLYMGAGIAGIPTLVSNVVRNDNSTKATPDNSATAGSDIFYGNWSDLLIAYFGSAGVSLLLNEYGTGYASGAVQLRSIMFADVAIRHDASFSRYQKITTA